MSTGRSPPRSLDDTLDETSRKRIKTEHESGSVLVNGIDSALVRELPQQALADIIIQALPSSTALKAIVLDRLQSKGVLDDDDATDLESLSGEEASSQDPEPGEEGQFAGLGLSVLSKLIMEIMNSAPAPEGGMPWREFEGIWPPVMGSVEESINECLGKGLLLAVDGNHDFVISTMPITEP